MNSRSRGDNGIDRWEVIKVLMSEKAVVNGADIEVSLMFNRPIFKDGNEGFPKASIVLSRNNISYRIPFFKGSSEEPEEIHRLFGKALELWHESAYEEYEDYVASHRADLDVRYERESAERVGMMQAMADENRRDHREKRRRRRNGSDQDDF